MVIIRIMTMTSATHTYGMLTVTSKLFRKIIISENIPYDISTYKPSIS